MYCGKRAETIVRYYPDLAVKAIDIIAAFACLLRSGLLKKKNQKQWIIKTSCKSGGGVLRYQIVFTCLYSIIFLSLVIKGIECCLAKAVIILSAGSGWKSPGNLTD